MGGLEAECPETEQ